MRSSTSLTSRAGTLHASPKRCCPSVGGYQHAVAMATEVIGAFPAQYRRHLLRGQRAKLGLRRGEPEDDRRYRAGRRLVDFASRRAGGFHPRVAAARRRRRRRRSATARAVCRSPRPMHGWPAGGHAAPARTSAHSMARRSAASSAPRRCAASIPTSSPATIAWKRRWPPRPTTAISRPSSDCSMPSGGHMTRPASGACRRAGASRGDGVLSHVLRHLIIAYVRQHPSPTATAVPTARRSGR